MTAKTTGIVVGALAAVGIAAAAFAGAAGIVPAGQTSKLPLIRAATSPVFAPPPGAPQTFADIFAKVSPAVVSLDVKSKISMREMMENQGIPPNALPFFQGRPGGRGGDKDEDEDTPSQEAMSSGSGFFISSDGYIVTNNHVVENANEITVILKDEREFKAKVVGRDKDTDLAVIKVEGRGFPYVNFENSGKPRVGDWVLAVGNPFGLGGTATSGIVSAYGRNTGDQFVDFIQIDAAINRGNSGGPTFDVYGRVIGVNSAIFSPTGGSVGIGFAIPAEVADNITKSLIAGGKVTRGFLGVRPQDLSPDDLEALGLPVGTKGAKISSVTPGGPASAAGVEVGDIITKVNDQPVKSASGLTRAVAGTRTGDTIKIEVLRDGKPKMLTVKSGDREKGLAINDIDPGSTPAAPEKPALAPPGELGLRLGALDDASRKTYGLSASQKGVVIDGVKPTSDAGKKGIQRGDVIVNVNDKAVSSPEDVAAAVAAAKKLNRPSVYLLVGRKGNQFGLSVKIGE
ncbi:Do family serine endopeptidase [soil metagenome]